MVDEDNKARVLRLVWVSTDCSLSCKALAFSSLLILLDSLALLGMIRDIRVDDPDSRY